MHAFWLSHCGGAGQPHRPKPGGSRRSSRRFRRLGADLTSCEKAFANCRAQGPESGVIGGGVRNWDRRSFVLHQTLSSVVPLSVVEPAGWYATIRAETFGNNNDRVLAFRRGPVCPGDDRWRYPATATLFRLENGQYASKRDRVPLLVGPLRIGDRAHGAQSFSLPQAEHITAPCRTPEAPQPAYRYGPHIGWGLDALAP